MKKQVTTRVSPEVIRMGFVGCGSMARHRVRKILQESSATQVAAVCEPSGQSYEEFCQVFDELGHTPPPNQPQLERFLLDYAPLLDAVYIMTPHAMHHLQAQRCMESGLDVLLEKPMVISGAEAQSLIETRDRTGRLLVVSFDGSLSPQIRTAVNLLRSGELGPILNISATVWQNWRQNTAGTWRQIPDIAGGGFLFDTGAHMLNTVSDLAGEDFVEVAAWLDNRAAEVDILGAVMGRLRSGALVTMNACGETARSCHSDVHVFCTHGILRTGVWGERLLVQRGHQEQLRPVRVPASLGPWQQFRLVRAGHIPNPSPPEIGLRMAHLWDAIQASAQQGGHPVPVGA